MNLQHRIDLFAALGHYLEQNAVDWQQAKEEAFQKNPWFSCEFIDIATKNIIDRYLKKELLENWAEHYHLDDNIIPKNVGIVMAGNIPMVGFHDFLSVCISGHFQTIKLSSKDDVLIKHIVKKLFKMAPEMKQRISFESILKGRDAYIATGSNNSARYFEQYFSKYPNIIRHNKTSVAILNGKETDEELEKLSDDIHLYFGLGCRNVTKIYVPGGYNFIPLLNSFNKYAYFRDQNKYTNNYDYQLSVALLNNIYYMTNGSTLLIENNSIFSPISVLHYQYYDNEELLLNELKTMEEIQCINGTQSLAFGQAQKPGLLTYADGLDTMQFLLSL